MDDAEKRADTEKWKKIKIACQIGGD